ncbi:MAG: hypothetical protein AB7P08_17285 [Burkholderiales bacterium]
MKIIPVTNPTDSPIFIGDRILAPGDTRHFPEAEVPEHLRLPPGHTSCHGVEAMPEPGSAPPAGSPPGPAAAAASENPLVALLTGSVEEITLRLAEVTDMSVIGELEDLELAKDAECRREVLSALADRQFAIADERHRLEDAAAEAAAAKAKSGEAPPAGDELEALPAGEALHGDGSGAALDPIP